MEGLDRKPTVIKYSKAASTHNGILIKAVLLSDGPVLEIGAGLFSTPLLHWLCKMTGKTLITYENDPDFYAIARKFRTRTHRVHFIENWDEMDSTTHFGVVFVDHAPEERRIVDIEKYKDKAEYMVIHDTESDDTYGYEKVWPLFKYRYDWKEDSPYTTVVSNFHNLDDFGKPNQVII